MDEEIWRLPRVMRAVGMGRSWIYLAVAEGRFPAPIKLGKRAVGWRRADVQAWLESRFQPEQ
ncbi:MAG: AlpA family phage regulatory protein [Oceanospirillaceae bacterium]|uniref:helix-turn-helix transcriptional regulator n=1 Tax=Salipiger sp. HF18 TaxID=2721557 RepID=UPI00142DA8B4|nr:AlpA family phage regulatory protein [Salipiger sp. HF18]NIY97353.1 AlpA family phage regulatory protein [Salipiger sp. HF18]NVK41963.1 AlpA family phage regulatory protein [Oceanospirillaceae bacterium]